MSLLPLTNHEEFERLYNPPPDQKVSYPILINFTANWCGPCKRVDWDFLLQEFGDQFAAIYKCDVDQNKYTPGFCGARSIPAWLIIKGPKKVEGTIQISDTAKIATWIFNTLKTKSN
jgi:thiol-disulfide isomerase/thioredoxin